MNSRAQPDPENKNSTSGHPRDDRHSSPSAGLGDTVQIKVPALEATGTPLRMIGAYQLIRPMGRGGMGTVFEAEQSSPRRRVAVKLIREGLDGAEARARFRLEGEILGRLDHEGIARIYEAGVAETEFGAEPFIAMEYIEGVPLDVFIEVKDPPLPQILTLLERTISAVGHAHSRGVVHRDLKPGNVLVTHDGTPKIVDFGISRLKDTTSAPGHSPTESGQILGTLTYMSPEQANSGEVNARSDVYSLGVVLYEVLTGHLPYKGHTPSVGNILRAVTEADHVPIRDHQPGLDRDLGIIVHHALAKDPAHRYADAGVLAEDLRRYLQHQPILARAPNPAYVFGRFIRRHRAVCAGLAGTFLTLVAALFVIAGEVRDKDAALRGEAAARLKAVAGETLARESRNAADAALIEARDRLAEAESVRSMFERVITSARGDALGRDVRVVDALPFASRFIENSFVDQPLVEGSLRRALGRTYSMLEAYGDARRELNRAIEIFEAELPHSRRHLALTLLALGECESSAGDFETAHDQYSDALTVVRGDADTLGEVHAQVLLGLAASSQRLGRVSEAVRTYPAALAELTRLRGERSAERARALGDYGIALHDSGQIVDAVKVYDEALSIYAALGQGERSNTAICRMNLGNSLVALGRHAEAIPHLRRALEVIEKTFGVNHLIAAQANVALSRGLLYAKEIDEAESSIKKAVKILGEKSAVSPVSQAGAFLQLGDVLLEKGDVSGATESFQTAHRHAEQSLGRFHPLSLNCRYRQAELHRREARLDDAWREYSELLKLADEGLDPKLVLSADYYLGAAEVLEALGRREEARRHFDISLKRFQDVLGVDHPKTRSLKSRIAGL